MERVRQNGSELLRAEQEKFRQKTKEDTSRQPISDDEDESAAYHVTVSIVIVLLVNEKCIPCLEVMDGARTAPGWGISDVVTVGDVCVMISNINMYNNINIFQFLEIITWFIEGGSYCVSNGLSRGNSHSGICISMQCNGMRFISINDIK